MDKNLERDERILFHVGLYRVTFREVLSRCFFNGRTPGNVVQRLLAEGRLVSRGGLTNRVRYYQLTPTEALDRGLPVARARPPKPQAFLCHIGLLEYCCLDPRVKDRRRLDHVDMLELFGSSYPKGPHVLQGGSHPRVFRAFVLSPGIRLRPAVKVLRRRVDRLRGHPTLGPWIRKRQYAVLFIVRAEAQRTRLQELITRYEFSKRTEVEVHVMGRDWAAWVPLGPPSLRPGAPR